MKSMPVLADFSQPHAASDTMTHLRPLICLRAASDEALLEEKHSEGLARCHKGIDPQVKLQAIKQKWFFDVMRGYSVGQLSTCQRSVELILCLH